MSKLIINKELLISLVKSRPELWDKSNGLYKDKGRRKRAWQEILELMRNDFDTISPTEKYEYEKYVVKTWSQLRDSWVRSLHDRKRGKISRPYIYHQHLLFLKAVIKHESVVSDSEDSETNIIDEPVRQKRQKIEIELPTNEVETIPTTSKFESQNRKRTNERMIPMTNTSENQEYDRHLAFFRSIQPSLSMLNDDQVLQFQSGVINLLRRVKSGNRYECQPSSSTHWQSQEDYNPPRDSPSIGSDVSEDPFQESKFDVSENSQ